MSRLDSKHYNRLTMDAAEANPPMGRYPRPLLCRNSYICLNGVWDCGVKVPYPLESEVSGFTGAFTGEYKYYRKLVLPKGFIKDRVILHFEGVDQIAAVYIDDYCVGRHEGGYIPFEIDITDYVEEEKEHILRVNVTDTLSTNLPYGKQTEKRGGMWYTPVSGIWKSVWLESVPSKYIEALEITPNLNGIMLHTYTPEESIEVSISFKGETILKASYDCTDVEIIIDDPRLWTPEEPNLYDITIKAGEDEVESYFALRTVSIGEVEGVKRILLNGEPYFFNGVLDQGYFPEGIFTPADERVYEEDILRLKALGINTIRKHIKIEPECFYEACDRLGMLVFQDMVNNGVYGFMRDTLMPTLGFRKKDDTKSKLSDEAKLAYVAQMQDTIALLYSHPCVVYYTLFNEGWGQFDSDVMYCVAKSMDKTRIIDSTSGWFWQNYSDVDSHHEYFKKMKFESKERPMIISEFGGFSLELPEHSFNNKNNYGYGKVKDSTQLTEMIDSLYRQEIMPMIPKGLCGTIYTQATDVEDETNGFYTYDRKVCKVNAEIMLKLAEDLKFKK